MRGLLVLLFAVALSPLLAHGTASAREAAEARLVSGRPASRRALDDFLRIPSVSSQRARAAEVRRAAEWLGDRLESAGLEDVTLLESAPADGCPDGHLCHPAVYGEWLGAGAGAATVLVYGHYDVQPEEPVELWDSPPFEPTVVGDRMFGRGVSDDKGHMYTTIAAVEAWLGGKGMPVNVKFLLEGEEEVGSPHLRGVLEREGERFKADYAFSADGGQISPEQPGLCLGLRGSVALQVDVFGAESDGHSGTYGGGVANPLHALAELLAGLHSADDGTVLVPGMYDDVESLTDEERAEFRNFEEVKPAAEVLAAIGANVSFGEEGFTFYERTWARPSLEVVGMWGGYQGDGIKTVLPASAHAKLSARLVARQDPDEIGRLVAAHLEGAAARMPGVRVEVTRMTFTARPYLMAKGGVGNRAAAAVLTDVFDGVEPLYFRMGGSIPVMDLIREIVGVEPVMFAFGHGDENVHAPNEFARVSSFDRAEVAYVRLFELVAVEHAKARDKEEL